MALLRYSPSEVTVSIAGLHTVTGYADGTFIKISKEMKPFETQRAMDGTKQRLYHYDEGYKLELTLAQSSPSNNVLSTLYNIDAATRMMKFPIVINDGSGQTSFFSMTSWIEQIPDVTFSNQMETRTWTFSCQEAALIIGGNDNNTSDIEDAILAGSAALPVLKDFGLF